MARFTRSTFILITAAIFGIIAHLPRRVAAAGNDVTSIVVDISLAQGVAHVGENVTLTCRVAGGVGGDEEQVPALRWVKSAVGEPGSAGGEELIASGEQLSPLYARQDRYEAVVVPLSEITLYILTIYLVTHEDSGRIRCAVSDSSYYYLSSDSVDSAVLQVYKRPSELTFVGHPAGSELTLTENEPTLIQCLARRVLPLPQFHVHVHNRSTGHHMATNATINVYCRNAAALASQYNSGRRTSYAGTGDKSCLVHYDLDSLATVAQFSATHRDDGHHVTCSATLPHSNWTPSVTSLVLNVRYKPRFQCVHSVGAALHSSDVTLECRVAYNPRPTSMYVTWRHEGQPDEQRLDAGNSLAGQYQLYETPTGVSRRDSELVFTIRQVDLVHYIVYQFHAVNEIGSATHSIRLIRSYPARTTTVSDRTANSQRPSHPATFRPPVFEPNRRPQNNNSPSRTASDMRLHFLSICLVALCVHSGNKLHNLFTAAPNYLH